MTESLGLRVHSFAPRYAPQLSHVIQRERSLLFAVIQSLHSRRRIPLLVLPGKRRRFLKFCCHSRAPHDGNLGSPRPRCTAPCGALSNSAVIQREPTATEESPGWLMEGNDPASQTLLSFSRSARESPCWFLHGSALVPPRPPGGDPRFARMTEERATLPRPRLCVGPSLGDSTGFAL